MLGGHGGNVYDLAQRHGCSETDIIDMSCNINPLGSPPGLLDYLKANLSVIGRLPEVDNRQTIQKFADFLSINPERILAGNGTTQFIYAIPQVLNIRKALIVGPTYSDYADACCLHQLDTSIALASESSDFIPDIGFLENKIRYADTVFLCNPNNPTGSYIPSEDLTNLCRNYPETRFIIDESYLPFVDDGHKKSMITAALENVLVLQSISKIYAIPGLRIGFLIASVDRIAKFRQHLPPWSLNSMSQTAMKYLAAQKSLIDSFVDKTQHYIRLQREEFFRNFRPMSSLKLYPSHTPFFLIRLPDNSSSKWVCKCLADEKILIRDCSNFQGLSHQFIRISLKTQEANSMLTGRLVSLMDESARRFSLSVDNPIAIRI